MTHDKPGGFDEAMVGRWEAVTSPQRPSPGEVALYKGALGDVDEALLLGATPEIRSAARELGTRLVVADLSELFYSSMERLVEGDPGGETFVNAGWTEMQLDRQFGLVMGDGALNMLAPDLQQRFFDNISRHTAPGGRLLLRVSLAVDPPLTPGEVIERARAHGGHLWCSMKMPLSQLWRDPDTGAMSNPGALEQCERLYDQGLLTDSEYGQLVDHLKGTSVTVYFIERQRVEALLAPYFDIVEVASVDDWPDSWQKPMFTLTRRP